MPDRVLKLVNAARQRVRRAEETVTTFQLEIARRQRAGSLEDTALVERLQGMLASRIAERDEARKELEILLAQPRWKLEQLVSGQHAEP